MSLDTGWSSEPRERFFSIWGHKVLIKEPATPPEKGARTLQMLKPRGGHGRDENLCSKNQRQKGTPF